jgi:coenzyme F420-reducing hydrogenase delta subunit
MAMNTNTFEPTIVAFCCHFCAYAAADLAGSGRLQYPPNVRIIRSPCTGRLEVDFFMKAFEHGVDGVLVAGCEEGSCHFKEGNLLAKRRVGTARQLLLEAGLDPERLRMVNVSAASSQKFAADVRAMVDTVRKLGPANITSTPATEQTGARS